MLKVLSLLMPAALLVATACSSSSANPAPTSTSTPLPEASPTTVRVSSPSTATPTAPLTGDQSPTPAPSTVVQLFNEDRLFQGYRGMHSANGLEGVPELESAGKDLVVELSSLDRASLDAGSYVEINFGAGFENWVSVPFTLSATKYHLHRDGTLRLEPDTGPPETVQLRTGEGPTQFRATLDQAILGRHYAYNLTLTSSTSVLVRLRVQTEAFE